ncbi:MAG: riboflavin biosynthesis protein RibF [Phycisphaerae bacterium]
MKVYRGIESVDPPLTGVILAVGNFDGLHRGHQQILAQACTLASRDRSAAVVITFDRHPLTVLDPPRAPQPLTPIQHRLALIADCGVHATVVLRSESDLLSLWPEQFIEQIVIRRFRPRAMVEGRSWRFGRHRQGDIDVLQALGRRHGFAVCVVPDLTIELQPGQPVLVSSSLIRRMISDRQMHQASLCLGRPYSLWGRVVPGDRRGGQLGVPTANIEVADQLVPPPGVYAGRAYVGRQNLPAAVHIGPAPTFNRSRALVEAHLLDFDGQLYDQPIRLELLRWIRGLASFPTAQQLGRQIQHDLHRVRSVIESST